MKLFDKLLAKLFFKTTVDETVETILGRVLEHINKLQELGEVYGAEAASHDTAANLHLRLAEEAADKESAAVDYADQLGKIVSKFGKIGNK